MKYLFLLCLSFFISSCKNNYINDSNFSEINRSALTGKSRIVQKPTLLRMGILPVPLASARSYMVSIYKKLIPYLERTNITYQMAGNDIILTIQSHILLDENFNIVNSIKPQLNNIIKILSQNNQNFIEIVGHTSSIGSSYNNLIKSKTMAQTVAKYFINKNIIPQRIFMTGMGETHWIAPNNTKEGQYLNNRIEIKISPLI